MDPLRSGVVLFIRRPTNPSLAETLVGVGLGVLNADENPYLKPTTDVISAVHPGLRFMKPLESPDSVRGPEINSMSQIDWS